MTTIPTPFVADEYLLSVCHRAGLLAPPDGQRLVRDCAVGTPLVDFLVAAGVFDRSARHQLALARKGYVTLTDAASLLTPGGADRLKALLARPAVGRDPQVFDTVQAAATPPVGSPPGPPRGTRPEIGQVLGKCLLTEHVGQGSSGTVFRGLHQTLNVPVAVKVLALGAVESQAAVRRQLKSEARLLAQLNHPHVVRVWDLDDAGDPPFLVMEYVEGLSLGELVQQSGRLRPDRAVTVITQVAAALDAAAGLGIVHRDVKPANVLVGRDGTAKLADLGLAVVVGGRNATLGDGLPADTMAGTVAYMSPEQAVAAPDVDHRSDIYALGGTFYHALTGRLPFNGRTRMEVILKHAKEPPLPPHELVPDVDPAVSAVVLRMMAKKPADRYATYADLLASLAALAPAVAAGDKAARRPGSSLDGKPLSAGRPSVWRSLFGSPNSADGGTRG